jgi:cell wall-associated NlpC family hydrolase
MKKYVTLFLLFFHVCSYGIPPDNIDKAKEILSSVQKKYAPDKRTDIFQAQVQSIEPLRLVIETTVPEAIRELKALLSKENITAEVSERLLPSKDLGDQIYGIVNLSVANNRVTPANQAELATQTLMGTPVLLLKKQSGYYLVRTPDSYLSYIPSGAVSPMDEASYIKWKTSEKLVYTQEFGHSFQNASKRSSPVSDIVHGDIVQLQEKKRKFYKVVYPDNRTAYVPVKSVTPYNKWVSRPNPVADQIINVGKTMMGVPYLWGGTSIKGMDCSGFTKTCYYLNGIVLPRDASQQALVGEQIDVLENEKASIEKCLKNLQPGDLLFFGSRRNGIANVTHTAIYMGNGEYIEESGLVRIGSMVPGAKNYSTLVSSSLVSASRMLNSIGTPGITRVDQHPFYTGLLK